MKQIQTILMFCGLASLIAACQTINSAGQYATGAVQTPAQIASEVCPSLTAALTVFGDQPGGLSPAAVAAIQKAKPIVAAVCSGAASVNVADLNSINESVFPALSAVINATNIPNKQQILLDLGLAQGVMAAVIVNLPNQTPALAPKAS